LKGHRSFVYSLLDLPNGLLASSSQDQTIKIWNLSNGSLYKTLYNHTDSVMTLALLPNGNLASGSLDDTIKIWNSSNDWLLIGSLSDSLSPSFKLLVLSNELLASVSKYQINIWNFNTMLLKRNLREQNIIYSTIFIENNQLAVGSLQIINIWNINEGKILKTIYAHESIVYALTMLTNGDFASGSGTNIKVWDKLEFKEKLNLNLVNYVDSFMVLNNGDLASLYFNEYLEIRNPFDGKLKAFFDFNTNKIQSSILLRNNNLVLGLIDGSIQIFKISYQN